jgi:hypothetical protein
VKFSEERISHLAHLLTDGVWKDDLVEWSDEGLALRTVKEVLTRAMQQEEEIDRRIRAQIAAMPRKIAEGSADWEMTYRRLYEQEIHKAWK